MHTVSGYRKFAIGESVPMPHIYMPMFIDNARCSQSDFIGIHRIQNRLSFKGERERERDTIVHDLKTLSYS